uniref:lysoplasmalogenase n=1 Tax=Glossina brevipalpis TaxID=37001 RepID=A0A1A9WB56_9MUSC
MNDKTQTTLLQTSHAVKLLPFLISFILYFIFQPYVGVFSSTALKCAPIISLMLYILMKKEFDFSPDCKRSRLILWGLIFSCGGDILLNVGLFPHGMALFGVAQIFYIRSFGWTPLKMWIGAIGYLAGAAIISIIYDKLDKVLKIGIPIYSLLLETMCWRSLARIYQEGSFFNICCGIGGLLFLISDSLIGLNMFLLAAPSVGVQVWIMITYYLAQLGITLSTANECKATSLKSSASFVKKHTNNSRLHVNS